MVNHWRSGGGKTMKLMVDVSRDALIGVAIVDRARQITEATPPPEMASGLTG